MSKEKGRAALKKIISIAKEIRRHSPGKKWTTAVKEASAEYRKHHKK